MPLITRRYQVVRLESSMRDQREPHGLVGSLRYGRPKVVGRAEYRTVYLASAKGSEEHPVMGDGTTPDELVLGPLPSEQWELFPLDAEVRLLVQPLTFRAGYSDHSIGGLRLPVAAMTLGAELKLRTHDHDRGERGWIGDDPRDLLARVKEEVAELEAALDAGDWQKALEECLDGINFLTMVGDTVTPNHLTIDDLLHWQRAAYQGPHAAFAVFDRPEPAKEGEQ